MPGMCHSQIDQVTFQLAGDTKKMACRFDSVSPAEMRWNLQKLASLFFGFDGLAGRFPSTFPIIGFVRYIDQPWLY
jgi:hypothetical protein